MALYYTKMEDDTTKIKNLKVNLIHIVKEKNFLLIFKNRMAIILGKYAFLLEEKENYLPKAQISQHYLLSKERISYMFYQNILKIL